MACNCRKVDKKKGSKAQVKKANVKLVKAKTPMIILPQLTVLEENINKVVIGQEQVVKSVCTRIYEGLVFPNIKNNILLVGKSGTGKTEIIRQIS